MARTYIRLQVRASMAMVKPIKALLQPNLFAKGSKHSAS
jgi:hypothetical protein